MTAPTTTAHDDETSRYRLPRTVVPTHYDLVLEPDLDAALDWASQATVACRGPVEVRPFQDEPET